MVAPSAMTTELEGGGELVVVVDSEGDDAEVAGGLPGFAFDGVLFGAWADCAARADVPAGVGGGGWLRSGSSLGRSLTAE